MKNLSIAIIATICLCFVSIFVGVIDLMPTDIFSDPHAASILLISRIPRTLAVILTGSSMAVAGLIMQLLVRNRYVEPATAGTAQSAALGILAVTILTPNISIFARMCIASLFSLIGTAIFIIIVRRLPTNRPLLIPLVGFIYGGVIGAAVTFFAYQADLLQYLDIWMNGEFSGVLKGRYELLWLSGLLTVLAYLVADQLTIAGLGRDMSLNLGLNYGQIVAAGLVVVSVTTALGVVTVGMIPFVGLVVPNIVSRMCGDNLRETLPWVATLGAGMVLTCDLLGRIIRHPFEVPVGTVFGVVGAVIFLWLLFHRPRHA